MTEFCKMLDEATANIRETVQQERIAADAIRREQLFAQMVREQKVSHSHGVAIRFNEKYLRPLISEMQSKIIGGIRYESSKREDGFAECRVKFGETEYLALGIQFDESGVSLYAQASCNVPGIVYSKRSEVFELSQFDEKKAEVWMQSHALEAFRAFGQKTGILRNPPARFTYNGMPLE